MMHEIEPGLYLGNIFAFRSFQALSDAGITHILSALNETIKLPDGMEHIKHRVIRVDDYAGEDILRHFAETNRFIDEALAERTEEDPKGAILVHCHMGVSRSATIVAAYLMKKHRMTASDAIHKLQSIRAVVCPNLGFENQLKVYKDAGYDIEKNPDPYTQWKSERSLANSSL